MTKTKLVFLEEDAEISSIIRACLQVDYEIRTIQKSNLLNQINKEDTLILSENLVDDIINDNSRQISIITIAKNRHQNRKTILQPFHVNQLINIINTESKIDIYKIGPWVFSLNSNELKKSDQTTVSLTNKEHQILHILTQDEEKPHTKEALLFKIWGYNNSISTHTLETYIYRLRQKLEYDTHNPKLITMNDGQYQLNEIKKIES